MISPKNLSLTTVKTNDPKQLEIHINRLVKRIEDAYRLLREDVANNAGSSVGVESDPVFSAWDKSSGISITESQIDDLGSYIESESDPVFEASAAKDITVGDTNRLYFVVGGTTYYVEGTLVEAPGELTGQPIGLLLSLTNAA